MSAHATDASIGVRCDLDRPILIAFLYRVGEMLAAVLDPFHRAVKKRRGGDHRNILGIHAEFRAETAADIRRRHAQSAFVEIDEFGKRMHEIVRFLGRRPHRQLAVGDLRKDAATFHRMGAAAMNPELVAQHVRGAGKRRRYVAVGDLVGHDLVRREFAAHRRYRFVALGPAVGRRRQHVIVDGHECGGILGNIASVADHDGDRFADKRHFSIGERERPAVIEPRARIRDLSHAALLQHRSEIVEREDRDNSRQSARGARVDAAD